MSNIRDYSVDHLAGMQVGTSTIIKELARGGMAIVFIAFQRTLKRQIAVKLLPKSLLTPETADLFHQEAEAAAILSHPNIIPVYEVGETDEFLFFTMQLVQGSPLSQYMKAAKKNPIPSKRLLPLPVTIKIVTQVLDALNYAHSQDIVHRDIKPGNIMIEKHNQRPLVMDFGLVKVLRENSEKKSAVHGTPLYMPPEQILSRKVDGRADIYAVGTMLFQMIVDKLPLPNLKSKPALLKHKVLNKEGIFLKKPSELNPNLNEDMDRIMLKAVAHSPAQRYATCREFREDLEDYQKQYVPRQAKG
jgi:serine/threonine-protein kinase